MPDRPGPVSGAELSTTGQSASVVRWLILAVLLVFTGPLIVALIILAVWWLIPSVHGRGRDLRPFVAPAVGGWASLLVWTFLSGRSPLDEALAAQVMLVRAFLVGSDFALEHLLGRWLTGSASLVVGLSPSLALLAAWKISRRATDEHISPRVADQARAGAEHPVGGVLLGFMPDGRSVTLHTRELGAHMLVAGGTNAGKSTLVKRHVEGLSRLGHVVLVLDGKADPALSEFLRNLSPNLRLWHPGGHGPPLHLLGGSSSEFAAKLIDVHRWTEPHYRAINHRYALQLGAYFVLSREPRTPSSVIRLLVPDNLDAAADALSTRLRRAGELAGSEAALAITTYTAELLKDPARRLVIAGLADRFAGIVEGGLAGCLDDAPGAIALQDVLADPGLWYIGLPGDTMPDEIAALGAWLLLELARVAHYRRSAGALEVQAHVVVEELSAFGHGALHLEHLLARARDAGIALMVTTQALADVRALSPTLPDQLLANTGVQVFFHMRDREAAWAASALGSGEAERETVSEDPDGGLVRRSRRTSTVPLVPEWVLENFGVGDAILSAAATITGGERRLERFRVALPGSGSRRTWRSAAWVPAATAATTGGLVAALVLAAGALNTPDRQTADWTQTTFAGVQTAILPTRGPSVAARPSPAGTTATRMATQAPAASLWRVANTDHLGVYLRGHPDGPTLRAWPDGSRMEAAGAPELSSGGEVWERVRAPDGATGWIKERYLVPANNNAPTVAPRP